MAKKSLPWWDCSYGYTHVKSGEVNKKGKELLKLIPYEKESVIVQVIFNMVFESGYGANRIAKHLNGVGAPTRQGGRWSTATINTMVRNPIYKGYKAYGKRSAKSGSSLMSNREEWILPEKPNKDLILVIENVWDRVQEIRTKRNPENVSKDKELINPTKSPLLMTGVTRYGHCDSAITTTYNYKSWTLADGTKQKKRLEKYHCSGKALRQTNVKVKQSIAKKRLSRMYLNKCKFI